MKRMVCVAAVSMAALGAGCSLIPLPGQGSGGESSSSGSKAAAEQPAWCKNLGYSDYTDLKKEYFNDDVAELAEWGPAAQNFAEAVCAVHWDRPEEREFFLALRLRWMEYKGYDERDFVAAAATANHRPGELQERAALGGAVAQVEMGYASKSLARLDELGARASMVARLMNVYNCFAGVAHDSQPLLLTILCTRGPLDLATAREEIDATPGINDHTRQYLRWTVKVAFGKATRARAYLDAKGKDDPGIAKVIAIADATFAEWAEPTARRAALIALVEGLEQATALGKRSAFAGCEAKVTAAWEGVVAGLELPRVPAQGVLTTFGAAALGTAEGFLAFRALDLCSRGVSEDRGTAVQMLGSDVTRRGPRSATIAAWMAAAGDIKFDRRELAMAELLRELGLSNDSRSDQLRVGVINSIKSIDGTVQITFDRVTGHRDVCEKIKYTSRIQGISSTGEVTYQSICLVWGTEKVDDTAPPVGATAVTGHGLKRGMYLVVDRGRPIVATASARSSKAVWLLGAAVK